jgi:hypothetical protein
VTSKLPSDDFVLADHSYRRVADGPRDLWNVARHASEYLALEQLDDLRPPLLPPRIRGRDLPAVFESQHLWQVGEGICCRLVVVRLVRRRLVAARCRPQALDAELRHHVLMIFGGGSLRLDLLGEQRSR